jgi:hypothetical protein
MQQTTKLEFELRSGGFDSLGQTGTGTGTGTETGTGIGYVSLLVEWALKQRTCPYSGFRIFL